MSPDKFWSGWLKVTMWIIIATGLYLVITASFLPLQYLDRQIDRIFFPGQALSESIERLKRWLIAINGAIMTGWGCSMLYVVSYPFQRKEKWAWRCIFYPVIIWFFFDTLLSVQFGAHFNVIIDSILL